VIAGQYEEAYEHARAACRTGKPVELPLEF
jgi:hypothetical protein